MFKSSDEKIKNGSRLKIEPELKQLNSLTVSNDKKDLIERIKSPNNQHHRKFCNEHSE